MRTSAWAVPSASDDVRLWLPGSSKMLILWVWFILSMITRYYKTLQARCQVVQVDIFEYRVIVCPGHLLEKNWHWHWPCSDDKFSDGSGLSDSEQNEQNEQNVNMRLVNSHPITFRVTSHWHSINIPLTWTQGMLRISWGRPLTELVDLLLLGEAGRQDSTSDSPWSRYPIYIVGWVIALDSTH